METNSIIQPKYGRNVGVGEGGNKRRRGRILDDRRRF